MDGQNVRVTVQVVRQVREEVEIDLGDWISQVEAARLVGVEPESVRLAMNAGRLTTVWLGKTRGTLRADVDAWIGRRKTLAS